MGARTIAAYNPTLTNYAQGLAQDLSGTGLLGNAAAKYFRTGTPRQPNLSTTGHIACHVREEMQNRALLSLVSASNTEFYDLSPTSSEMRAQIGGATDAGSTTPTKTFFACSPSSAIDLAKLIDPGFCVWSPGFSRLDEPRVECSLNFHDSSLLDGPPTEAGTPCREGPPTASSQTEIFCNEFSILLLRRVYE
jgi:hypothetical protein